MVETFFTEKRIIKKIIIAIVFVFMFNFTFSYLGGSVVFADEAEDGGDATPITSKDEELEEGGGKLLLPIHSFLMFLTDAVMQLMQNTFLTSEPITLDAKSNAERSAKGIGWVIGGVIITAVAVLTWISPVPGDEAVGTSIAATWWAAGVGTKVLTTLAIASTIAGPSMFVYGSAKSYKNLKGEFKLPNIWYTPSQIFSGSVPLFDINFFNPADSVVAEEKTVELNLNEIDLTNYDEVSRVLSQFLPAVQNEEFVYTGLSGDVLANILPDEVKDYCGNGAVYSVSTNGAEGLFGAGNPIEMKRNVEHLAHDSKWKTLKFFISQTKDAIYMVEIVPRVDNG